MGEHVVNGASEPIEVYLYVDVVWLAILAGRLRFAELEVVVETRRTAEVPVARVHRIRIRPDFPYSSRTRPPGGMKMQLVMPAP